MKRLVFTVLSIMFIASVGTAVNSMFQQIKPGITVGNLSADPSGARSGDLYYNTSSNVFRFYNGSSWGSIFNGSSISQSLVPSATNTYDLGSTSKYWNNEYVTNITTKNIQSVGGNQLTLTSSANLNLIAPAFSAVDFQSSNVQNMAEVTPDLDAIEDFGSSSLKWLNTHQRTSILYGSTSGNISLNAANATTSYSIKMPSAQGGASTVLTNDGSGNLSWGSGGGSGLTNLNSQTGSTQVFANDTNVLITSSNNTHTLGWASTLGLTRGGTAASLTAGAGKVVYSTSTALALTASGTSGSVLQSNGASAPSWIQFLAGPGALTIVSRDSADNSGANEFAENFTSTAAGTITLTVSSSPNQIITGSGATTLNLPSAATLYSGHHFVVKNRSSGSVTVKDGGGSTIATVTAGSEVYFICTSVGSVAGSWDVGNSLASSASGISSLNSQTGATQVFANDTNVIVTSSNNTHSLGWASSLSIARGGTNNGSLSTVLGGVVYTDASKLNTLVAGTSGQALMSNGAAAPSWTSALKDSSGTEAVNWATRILKDTTPTASVSWDARLLVDQSAVNSVSWNSRSLIDPSNKVSIDWTNRILKDTTATFSMLIWSGSSVTIRGILDTGHLSSNATSPSATVNANAGTGASCSVSNATDVAGSISLTTTATAPSSGAQCDINFASSYGVAPICVISGTNNNSILFAVANGDYITTTTTKLTINYANADVVGHANTWAYHCIETQ